MNTWPSGFRHALSQSDHEKWNDSNHPGTRQICIACGEFTGRCEEDSILNNDGDPICENCYQEGVDKWFGEYNV